MRDNSLYNNVTTHYTALLQLIVQRITTHWQCVIWWFQSCFNPII